LYGEIACGTGLESPLIIQPYKPNNIKKQIPQKQNFFMLSSPVSFSYTFKLNENQ